MNNIYELIEKISQRTGMYTSECKLSNVRSFLDGYTFSITSESELEQFLGNFPGFHNWIAKKFGFFESTAGWQNMILAVELGLEPNNINWKDFSYNASENQHKASVQSFFKLVSEYKNA